jgi:hypothetical protein
MQNEKGRCAQSANDQGAAFSIHESPPKRLHYEFFREGGYSRGLAERLGKNHHFANPGFHWLIPVVDLAGITQSGKKQQP